MHGARESADDRGFDLDSAVRNNPKAGKHRQKPIDGWHDISVHRTQYTADTNTRWKRSLLP